MRKFHGIHWFAPSSMVGSIVAGVLLAVGHHLFYKRLDGTVASTTGIFGSDISRQQASIAIGTAFSFLVKVCLVYAVTIAYIQIFWKEAKARNTAPTLSTLDDIGSAIDNIFVLFKLPLWLSYYLLLIVATIAWLVPIASIITPATLSTQIAPVFPVQIESRRVPSLDFRSLAYVNEMRPALPRVYIYSGPSQPVSNIAGATMANGEILPLTPLASNSSWEIEFAGPTIKCGAVNDVTHQKFREDLFLYLSRNNAASASLNTTTSSSITLYAYMGWFPHLGYLNSGISDNTLGPLSPFHSSNTTNSTGNVEFRSGELYHTFYLFAASRTLAETYVGQFLGSDAWRTELRPGSRLPAWLHGTMVECTLLNASYQVGFNYTEGDQQIDIETSYLNDAAPVDPYYTVLGPAVTNEGTRVENDTCLSLSLGVDQTTSCIFDASVLKVLSYKAVWDAFTAILLGSVRYETTINRIRDSSIGDTALARVPELWVLRGIEGLQTAAGGTLQGALAAFDDPAVQGLDNDYDETWDLPLADALEETFRYVTVSLLSSRTLLPNNRSLTAPGAVNVTFPANRLVYTYSPWKLWLSYGLAILLTLAAVVVGFVTLAQNKASYSDDFSTVFRTARGAELSKKIEPQDLRGHDPLPPYLEKAWVTMRDQGAVIPLGRVQYQPVPLQAPLAVPAPPSGTQSSGAPVNPTVAQTPHSAASQPAASNVPPAASPGSAVPTNNAASNS